MHNLLTVSPDTFFGGSCRQQQQIASGSNDVMLPMTMAMGLNAPAFASASDSDAALDAALADARASADATTDMIRDDVAEEAQQHAAK